MRSRLPRVEFFRLPRVDVFLWMNDGQSPSHGPFQVRRAEFNRAYRWAGMVVIERVDGSGQMWVTKFVGR